MLLIVHLFTLMCRPCKINSCQFDHLEIFTDFTCRPCFCVSTRMAVFLTTFGEEYKLDTLLNKHKKERKKTESSE